MRAFKRLIMAGLSLILIGVWLLQSGQFATLVHAEDEEPEALHRTITMSIDVVEYEWWMARWKDNRLSCQIFVEHADPPTSGEILAACGPDKHEDWLDTPPCAYAGTSQAASKCSGVYLFQVGQRDAQREIEVELPLPEVIISLTGCDPQPPENRCDSLPSLTFTAAEPLPNETIVSVNGVINDAPFSCPGDQCSIPLHPTGPNGQWIEFWADSSFGDASEHYTALVRVMPWGDFMNPEGNSSDPRLWYVDVISSQWRGQQPASCADVWMVFPEVGGPPAWLTTPPQVEDLASSFSYYYLAGMLIRNGTVDTSACPDGGMATEFTASTCGVVAAQPYLLEWQNYFDHQILEVSQETGVPAQLMKNLFSRESQFWPGFYADFKEAGLGQMTENGADTVLLWNPSFFSQFCPLVLSNETCQYGFNHLSEEHQNMLRGALVRKVNASCPECPVGIDLTQANFSIQIFAESLLANCEQVGRVVYNTTLQSPGQVSSFIDLWRFTLVNYNAGAGCLSAAVEKTWEEGRPLNWENVAANLEPACRGAIQYVEDLERAPLPEPTPTPWLFIRVPTLQVTPEPGEQEGPAPSGEEGDGEDFEEDDDDDFDDDFDDLEDDEEAYPPPDDDGEPYP